MRANFVVSGVGIGIRRNLTMTIALVLSTAIALSFVGAALLANTEIDRFKANYQGKLNVSVYLCGESQTSATCHGRTSGAETQQLEDELRSDPRVASVSYVSEAKQVDLFRKTAAAQVARLTQKGDLPASFTVKLNNLQRDGPGFVKDYEHKANVSGATNQVDTLKKLLDIIDGFRLLSLVIAIVVLVASILLIGNTIQVAAAQRRNETSIMRLVGASRWMTELPFMLEAIFATVVGGLIAFGLVALGKHYVLNQTFKLQVERNIIPNLSSNDILIACGISLGAGVVLAALTAFATLRLYVRL